MEADIICIGDELLTGLVDNTNAAYLSRRLWACGIKVRERRVIADDEERIVAALEESWRHSDVVICSGGLGPTDDDKTREAVARFLNRPLELNRPWLDKLERFFAGRGYPMPEANRKQALAIKGSRLLDNPRGTAPGAIIEEGLKAIVLLPGPPRELEPMLEEAVLPFLLEKRGEEVWAARILKCTGLGESLLAEKIEPLPLPREAELSLVARGQEVQIQLKSRGRKEAVHKILHEATAILRQALEGYVYGEGDETLAGAVAAAFVRRGLTLGLAESCSGGLLSAALTAVPGCSRFYRGGVTAYSPEAKINLLGVDPLLLEAEGAVSRATAEAMAMGARKLFQADVGVGVTGLAGPEGDPGGRPVGTVCIAVGGAGEETSLEYCLPGTRRAVQERAVQAALTALWRLYARPGKK